MSGVPPRLPQPHQCFDGWHDIADVRRHGTIKVPVSGSVRSDNGEALVRAAIGGQWLVYGPRFIAADALGTGQLVELELDEPPMSLGAAYAITHPTRRPAAKSIDRVPG